MTQLERGVRMRQLLAALACVVVAVSVTHVAAQPTTRVTFTVSSNSYATFVAGGVSFCVGVCGRGFNVVVVDPATGTVSAIRNFDTWGIGAPAMESLLEFLRSIATRQLVMVASADETGLYTGSISSQRVRQFFQEAGSTLIGSYLWRDSWLFAYVVGRSPVVEKIGRFRSGIGWENVSARISVVLPATSPGDNVFDEGCTSAPAAPGFPNPPGSKVGNSVTLVWNPVSTATTYRVVADWNGSRFVDADVGSATTVSGLVPPGRYSVWIVAGNACGASPPSQPLVFDVP
jgi:hypothetical protein